MTNVYATTLVGAGVTSLGSATFTTQCTYEGAEETYKHTKYNKKINDIKNADYTYNTNIEEISLALHYLNPKEVIRIINPEALTDDDKKVNKKVSNMDIANKVIFSSASNTELRLPKGMGVYKDSIYSHTDDGKPYYIKVADVKSIQDEILLPPHEDRHFDVERAIGPIAIVGTTLATTISGNSYVNAATYDTKTYINSMSDEELEELCTNLEEKTLDEQVNETLERENVKKLVK